MRFVALWNGHFAVAPAALARQKHHVRQRHLPGMSEAWAPPAPPAISTPRLPNSPSLEQLHAAGCRSTLHARHQLRARAHSSDRRQGLLALRDIFACPPSAPIFETLAGFRLSRRGRRRQLKSGKNLDFLHRWRRHLRHHRLHRHHGQHPAPPRAARRAAARAGCRSQVKIYMPYVVRAGRLALLTKKKAAGRAALSA